jgi:hypothetical protein
MGLNAQQMQALLGGGLDASSLASALGQSDPNMGAMISALMQRQSASTDASVTIDREVYEREQTEHAAMQTQHEKLRRVAERMHEELVALRQRNRQLASAVGACPHCWGESPECELCGGEGLPGSAPPRRETFQRYVWPAARHRVAPGPASTRSTPPHRAAASPVGGPLD